MRVVDTFTQGGFPRLVLESKREFASKYGLKSEYWRHFKPEESPEVLAYLKTNLKDLATHYHAQYQNANEADEKLANYREASQWYGAYLESFPKEADSPPVNYQLADLFLENKDFGEAARQYERTAYGYAPHPQSAAAGYAAIYAYREQLKVAGKEQQDAVKRDTVASSLKFADAFPRDDHAAAVLGAAADDLYELKNYKAAIEADQRVIDNYPNAEAAIRRSAWIVVAHGSFELAEYSQAEHAYAEVLKVTPQGDESRASFVDNLAASIYKQGEIANEAQDYRAAADNFLRIRSEAPTSSIRATAEYDAGAALIRLEDWKAPVETAIETRFKIAEMYKAAHDESLYHRQLEEIVSADAGAGPERTGRTRTIAARSALVLAEKLYGDFVVVKLRQPFEASLQDKKQRMDATIAALGRLVNYEIAEVTAAATYYMAETYSNFSRSLLESERPADLKPEDLEEFKNNLDEAAFPFEEKDINVHE